MSGGTPLTIRDLDGLPTGSQVKDTRTLLTWTKWTDAGWSVFESGPPWQPSSMVFWDGPFVSVDQ